MSGEHRSPRCELLLRIVSPGAGMLLVDSTAQLLDWFKRGAGPSSNAGIFELYRQRAEEARERRVRLRVPPGIGHRNMPLLNVAGDGTAEMLVVKIIRFVPGSEGGSRPKAAKQAPEFCAG